MSENKDEYSKKKNSKHIKKSYEPKFDDDEFLRLQNLMRCKHCETPYPLNMVLCPVCGKTEIGD